MAQMDTSRTRTGSSVGEQITTENKMNIYSTDIQENTPDIDENFFKETGDAFSRTDFIQRTTPGVNSLLKSYINTLCETSNAPR